MERSCFFVGKESGVFFVKQVLGEGGKAVSRLHSACSLNLLLADVMFVKTKKKGCRNPK